MDDELADAIAVSLADWDVPYVELAIYGLVDPRHIAAQLREVCVRELRSRPTAPLFYRSSVGAVVGLELDDGTRVVVKAHQPTTTREHLVEVVRLQSRVESQLQLAPKVRAGPVTLCKGLVVIEEFVERGAVRNGHEPVIRRELARTLHEVIQCLGEAGDAPRLAPNLLVDQSRMALWPTPHSNLFDFEATRTGADYIDEIAARARAAMLPVGRFIIGHGDWRCEHVRFAGDKAVVGFDWDSLCSAPEPAIVGATAHMFCADWSVEGHAQAPTLDEARAFVDEYQVAAGRAFTTEDRKLCSASFTYAVAYTSRCGQASGNDSREEPGTFQHLLVTGGEALFHL